MAINDKPLKGKCPTCGKCKDCGSPQAPPVQYYPWWQVPTTVPYDRYYGGNTWTTTGTNTL